MLKNALTHEMIMHQGLKQIKTIIFFFINSSFLS